MNCNRPPETQYIGELPIDNLDSLPDYFIAERDVPDEQTGETSRGIVRVPSGKIFPNANTDNVYALDPNNTAITVPEKQVRACYVENAVSSIIMRYADNTHPPMFLALGLYAGMMRCQNSGVVNIPEGHNYTISQQYYVATDGTGEPVTASTSGKKLFIPISSTKLLINMG